jgi:hypothetical protein
MAGCRVNLALYVCSNGPVVRIVLFYNVVHAFGVPDNRLDQCFPTFVRPRRGKLFFYKTRAQGPTNLLVNTFPIFFKFIH